VSKRFGWIKDGLDAKDRIQKNSLKERASKENAHTRKLREAVQADEQTRINTYSEGYCYGCSKTDQVLSTLIYACADCMEKRGTEGIMCLVVKKNNFELCDICGQWKLAQVWQINISFCNSCMRRVFRIHKNYRKTGGRRTAPDEVLKRKIGKDMNAILGSGITRDQTKDQSFALG